MTTWCAHDVACIFQGDGQRDRSIYIKYVIPDGAAARVSTEQLWSSGCVFRYVLLCIHESYIDSVVIYFGLSGSADVVRPTPPAKLYWE